MPNLLFASFVIVTSLWILRRIFVNHAVNFKYWFLKKFSSELYTVLSLSSTLIRLILIFQSIDYLYFKNYYFYMAIVGMIVVFLSIPMLILGYLISLSRDKNTFKFGPLNQKWRRQESQRLTENLVVGIFFRTVYAIAWFKTFNFFNINFTKTAENGLVALLYGMTIYVLVYTTVKGLKKQKNKKIKTGSI